MSPLLDLPPEVILHIMKFARWSQNDPDYTSIKVGYSENQHFFPIFSDL